MEQYMDTDYYVTATGEVYSNKSNSKRKLQVFLDTYGYPCVNICHNGTRRQVKVHRLVAEQYLPPRPSLQHQIRHLDGNPKNNYYGNLKWGTVQENSDDKERHGRMIRGEKHYRAKLTWDQIERIRFLNGKVEHGYWAKLARSLGVDRHTIARALYGQTWSKSIPV